MCRAPEPDFRQILEDVRALRFVARQHSMCGVRALRWLPVTGIAIRAIGIRKIVPRASPDKSCRRVTTPRFPSLHPGNECSTCGVTGALQSSVPKSEAKFLQQLPEREPSSSSSRSLQCLRSITPSGGQNRQPINQVITFLQISIIWASTSRPFRMSSTSRLHFLSVERSTHEREGAGTVAILSIF